MLEQTAAGIQRHSKNSGHKGEYQACRHGRNARNPDSIGNEKDSCAKIHSLA